MVPGGGVEPPRGCPRRILSLILGTLQGVASRRNKSQQASYLHTDTSTFEVAMRRSQKQKSWKRTAIKTATYFASKLVKTALKTRRTENPISSSGGCSERCDPAIHTQRILLRMAVCTASGCLVAVPTRKCFSPQRLYIRSQTRSCAVRFRLAGAQTRPRSFIP
jgi:hypothetical protein